MKRIFLAMAVTAAGLSFANEARADIECRGQVVDDQGEPLIGALVQLPGTSKGTSTDIDGYFRLSVPDNAKELKITYVGYNGADVRVASKMGVIKLSPNAKMLQDVIVTQSVARTRQTPVALSSVDQLQIETKLGAQEFPEILKTTPGV